MRRLAPLLLVLALVGTACGDDDDAPATTTSTTEATTTTSTTEATTTSSTTAFEGSTDPTQGPSAAAGSTTLTDVQVGPGTVAFTFRDGTPGYLVQYTDEPITQDGSGAPVEVDGDAHLRVRFEPASSYDFSAGAPAFEPDRIPGEDPITEVVRTGDFEAVLNWVVGLDGERPFRVDVDGATITITFDVS